MKDSYYRDSFRIKISQIISDNGQKEEFSVSVLAKLIGLTERTLFRQCREYLSVSPSQIITNFRIEKSKTLLLTNLMPEEVAKKVGYKSKNAFYQAFKKKVRMPVGLFRESNLKVLSKNHWGVFIQLQFKLSKFSKELTTNTSDTKLAKILKNDFGVDLPQKTRFIDRLKASNSNHEVVRLLSQFLIMKDKMPNS